MGLYIARFNRFGTFNINNMRVSGLFRGDGERKVALHRRDSDHCNVPTDPNHHGVFIIIPSARNLASL